MLVFELDRKLELREGVVGLRRRFAVTFWDGICSRLRLRSASARLDEA
jgi:hypothetical protein